MKNIKIHWFEAKQLDRVTNFSTEVEVIKFAVSQMLTMKYYCTFKKKKEYYGFENNIVYLGVYRNRYIKFIEFYLGVFIKSLIIIFSKSTNVIIVNQDLIKPVLLACLINRWLKKDNKFIADIRTTPTDPKRFKHDMEKFHSKFKYAVKYFNGLSFITPFMDTYLMSGYTRKLPTIHWSSGVDVELFNNKTVSSDLNRDKRFTIFYHGGISLSRGNLTLIKACEKLKENGYDIKLQQIGIVVDSAIPEYIETNKLEGWCELLHPEDLRRMPQYIANCDLPVLPFPNFMAWRVSSPIKLMEYLAMGKKVLAPKIEAFTDVFGENEDLVFYFDVNKHNDVEAIFYSIKKIMDGQLLQYHTPLNSVGFVKDHYTWKKQAEKLINFCQMI